MTSQSVIINGINIWYDRFGNGPTPLLLIPGAIGTGLSEFGPQLEGENALDLNEFTIIAVELPGCGRSRPPLRPYGCMVYDKEAECCVKLMNHLGYAQFSAIGWCDGAKVALVIALNFPDSLSSVILCAIISFPTQQVIDSFLDTRDVNKWNNDLTQRYLKAYKDCDEIQELWDNYLSFMSDFGSCFPSGITHNKFNAIECSVLIVHGDQDPLVPMEQPLYLMQNIKGAQLHRFATGSHHFHHKFTSEFKKLVQDFILH